MATPELFRKQAKAALEKRAALIAELRSVDADSSLSGTEKLKRASSMDADISTLELEARDFVERADRMEEARALAMRAGGSLMPHQQLPEGEWRALMPSLEEYRAATQGSVPSAGGYTVPDEMSRKYVDLLRAQSTFMRALPTENVLTFESDTLNVPMLTASTGEAYVAELGTIPEGDMTWNSLTFSAKKIGRIQWASSEVLEDSALAQRDIIAQNLIRDGSLKFDADAFNGGLAADVKGVVAQGITTTLSAGNIVIKYDDLADAVARIEAINGAPSIVWASTDMAAALRKEKASGSGQYQGGSPTDSPASTAWGLPILVSGFLPAKTVVVADTSRLFVGIRRNAQVKISEDAGFTSDKVGFKLTMRVAGVGVAESASVQIVKAAAS